jgi:uncharacterized membrane protein YphA (DoxX/SURF4 family)
MAYGNVVPALKVYEMPSGPGKAKELMTTTERLIYYLDLLEKRKHIHRSESIGKPVDKDELGRLRSDITAIRADLLADVDKFTASLKDEIADVVRAPLKKISFKAAGEGREPILTIAAAGGGGTSLDPLFKKWDEYHDQFVKTYKLSDVQQQKSQKLLEECKAEMRQYLASDDVKRQLADYNHWVAERPKIELTYMAGQMAPYATGQVLALIMDKQVTGLDQTPPANLYQREEDAYYDLAKGYETHANGLPSRLALLLENPKTKAYPLDPVKPSKLIDTIDMVTMWTLTIAGACLLLGFFSRTGALVAMVFLVLTYLTYPAFPWLPMPPATEGNPLFVNKNVVEFAALFVLLTVPTGRWFGIDALIYYFFQPRAQPQGQPRPTSGGQVNGNGHAQPTVFSVQCSVG